MNVELLTFLRREMIKLSIHMTCFQDESINEYASFVSKGGGGTDTQIVKLLHVDPLCQVQYCQQCVNFWG